MYDFLWNGKPDKISRKLIIQTYENGGLKMIDIKSFINTLKASWITRLKGTKNQLKNAYNEELNKYGGDLVYKSNLNSNDAKHILIKYKFLNEIICSWCDINFKQVTTNISHEIMWHNTNIKNNENKTIFYKHWL